MYPVCALEDSLDPLSAISSRPKYFSFADGHTPIPVTRQRPGHGLSAEVGADTGSQLRNTPGMGRKIGPRYLQSGGDSVLAGEHIALAGGASTPHWL